MRATRPGQGDPAWCNEPLLIPRWSLSCRRPAGHAGLHGCPKADNLERSRQVFDGPTEADMAYLYESFGIRPPVQTEQMGAITAPRNLDPEEGT